MKEGWLPMFNKNYRYQWESCLSSNCIFDPTIWCVTMRFYCFCINAEKWPPCLLNHMKHLNMSFPLACSGKKNHIHPWLHEITLQSSCIDFLWCRSNWNILTTNSWNTTETFKSVLILLEWTKYSIHVTSNQLNTTLPLTADSYCTSTALGGQTLLLQSDVVTVLPFPAVQNLSLVTMMKERACSLLTVLMILYLLLVVV